MVKNYWIYLLLLTPDPILNYLRKLFVELDIPDQLPWLPMKLNWQHPEIVHHHHYFVAIVQESRSRYDQRIRIILPLLPTILRTKSFRRFIQNWRFSVIYCQQVISRKARCFFKVSTPPSPRNWSRLVSGPIPVFLATDAAAAAFYACCVFLACLVCVTLIAFDLPCPVIVGVFWSYCGDRWKRGFLYDRLYSIPETGRL